MNDASPRFGEALTGASLLSSTEEGAVSLTELTRRAGELSVWFTEEGLRGATAGELLRGILQTIIRDELRHHACIRVDPDLAPPMGWVWLHMATRIQFGA